MYNAYWDERNTMDSPGKLRTMRNMEIYPKACSNNSYVRGTEAV